MVLKNIAKIVKAHGSLQLWDGPCGQWIGDFAAAYCMGGMPELDELTAPLILDLTAKDLEKIEVKHYDGLPARLDFSDITEKDSSIPNPRIRVMERGHELLIVDSGEGYQLIDPDYLRPLKDIRDGLEWYERRSADGQIYFAAACGWVLCAIIMPLDLTMHEGLPEVLEGLAGGLRRGIKAAKERAAERGEGPGDKKQLVIDPETGEVKE